MTYSIAPSCDTSMLDMYVPMYVIISKTQYLALVKTTRIMKGRNWIKSFNVAVNKNPKTSMITFLVMRNVSWYSLFGIYSSLFSFGPELAVGYFVTKCTSKFRQPLNVAVAAVLLKTFPILKEIKSKALVGILSPNDVGLTRPLVDSSRPVPAVGSSYSSSEPKTTETGGPYTESLLSKAHSTVEYLVNGPVNTYGFALFLASRITMTSSVIAVSLCTYLGYDITAFLASYGISEAIQSAGGAMAVSTLTNVMFLPGHLYVLPTFITAASSRAHIYDLEDAYRYVSHRSNVQYRALRRACFK